ncbi:hypothetical protein IQ255_16380 [Pleurocapsales cyanobacterium LEGE 10410]|nr:hypothetical protein [Pleurocapsales cyanobacterium LEGE 10410]
MDKQELIKRAEDPKYIPGIYNYCDRWCERCQFTSRCLNHSLEEEQNCKLESIDEANKRFWYSIKDSFELAFSLIEDLAQQEGVDLESIEIDEDDEIDNKVEILTHRAMNYANMVDKWFENNQNILENELATLTPQFLGKNISNKKRSHLKLIHPHTTEISIHLKEAIEVINYYQYAITVKLSRAIKSRDNEAKIRLEDISQDSDGSAKIALIEIDRSINAWSELLKYFQAEPRDILKIINYLKQIREIAEKEFPNARLFIRPGFDEINEISDRWSDKKITSKGVRPEQI